MSVFRNLNPLMSFTGHVRKTTDVKIPSPPLARADHDPGPHCSAPVQELTLQVHKRKKASFRFLTEKFSFQIG